MSDKYEEAMKWLEEKYDKSETLEEYELIEWIREMIWRYEDMRDS